MTNEALALVRVRAMTSSGEARRIRQSLGLSLSEVGSGCSVDQSTVHRWETGKRTPRGQAALRYGALLSRLSRLEKADAS